MRKMLLAATAVALVFGATAASAQPYSGPQQDPYGYYSQYDHDGYYDRDGHYTRYDDQQRPNGPDQGYDNGPPPGYYEQGAYEERCRRDNNAAGTIFGALAGGLIGSAASHGNGGAVVGGAILGGMLGNTITHDMPCEDHPYAFRVYAEGLDGDLGRRYEWRHGDDYGYFVPEREFNRGGYICRSFSETTYRGGQSYSHSGTACRMRDGHWHFD
ncbi:MAG: hypothetical protein ABSD21_08870 [Rhizomicrobium sp.]|jgi:surface antigen